MRIRFVSNIRVEGTKYKVGDELEVSAVTVDKVKDLALLQINGHPIQVQRGVYEIVYNELPDDPPSLL